MRFTDVCCLLWRLCAQLGCVGEAAGDGCMCGTGKSQAGPNFSDRVLVSCIEGNWVQVCAAILHKEPLFDDAKEPALMECLPRAVSLQVADKKGYWLPIVGEGEEALLEVLEIVGAYRDAPVVYGADNHKHKQNHKHQQSLPPRKLDEGRWSKEAAGAWNPLLTARSCILSADRRAVHFPPGTTASPSLKPVPAPDTHIRTHTHIHTHTHTPTGVGGAVGR